MNLYKISSIGNSHPFGYHSAIVAAESEEAAKTIHPCGFAKWDPLNRLSDLIDLDQASPLGCWVADDEQGTDDANALWVRPDQVDVVLVAERVMIRMAFYPILLTNLR